jgi:ribosomal protein L33
MENKKYTDKIKVTCIKCNKEQYVINDNHHITQKLIGYHYCKDCRGD